MFISTQKSLYGMGQDDDAGAELCGIVYDKGISPAFTEQHSFWTFPSQENESDDEIDDAIIIAGFELYLEG